MLARRCRCNPAVRRASAVTTTNQEPTIFKFTTINLLDYGGDNPREQERFARVEQLVRTTNSDIVAVQELLSSGPGWDPSPYTKRGAAERSLRQLAEATGLRCEAAGQPTYALGRGRRHTGLLFRDGIDPVPGTLLRCEVDHYNVQNGLVALVFDIGGAKVRAGSAHMPVRDPGISGWPEAGVVMYAFSPPVPGLCGGDWQGIGADAAYDPDPYIGVPWHHAFSYNLGPDGKVDRSLAFRLEHNARFQDCAKLAGAPWQPTTGFHPSDPHIVASRRIDRIYATAEFPADAVLGFEYADLAVVNNCTDHLAGSVMIDEKKLAA